MPSDAWRELREARLAAEAAARDAIAIAEQEARQQQEELEARLKGAPGERGEKGERGERGSDGRDGKDGQHGRDGLDGVVGTDGRDGRDGAPGPAGRDGKDGAAGTVGPPGPRGFPGPYVTRADFNHDAGQRIASVVEYLSNGTQRTFNVQRDSQGRPVGLTLGE